MKKTILSGTDPGFFRKTKRWLSWLSMCLVFMFGHMSFAQIQIANNVDSNPTGWVLSGFTRTNSTFTPACEQSYHYYRNIYSSFTSGGTITSPNFTGASNGNEISISFVYKANEWGIGSGVNVDLILEYSTNNSTWNQIDAPINIVGMGSSSLWELPCTTYSTTLPAGTVAQGSDFKFRIRGVWNSGDAHVAVDNISIIQVATTPPNCVTTVTPVNEATNVAKNVTLSWVDAIGAPTSYDVYFGESATPSFVGNVTTTTYTVPDVLAANTTYFWKVVPKNEIGDAIGCQVYSFTTGNSFVYCTPIYSYGCSNGSKISNVVIEGGITNISNNTGTTSCGDLGYNDFSATHSAEIQRYTQISYTIGVGSYAGGVKIWIDFNQNGSFDEDELVAASTNTITSGGTFSGNFVVPEWALLGETKMRIRVVENSTIFTACSSQSYGETEDYKIIISPAADCITPFSIYVGNITANSADLSWTSTGDNYEISWGAGNFNAEDGTIMSFTSGGTISGLNSSSQYSFYVRQICSNNSVSAWAGPYTFSTVCAAPDAPLNISFTGVSTTGTTVNWTAPENAPEGYLVFRSTSNIPPALENGTIYTTSQTAVVNALTVEGRTYFCIYNSTGLSASASSLTSNTQYYYYVFSKNCSGNTISYSALPLSGSVITAPAAPTSFVANDVSFNSATLSWTAPSIGTGGGDLTYTVEVTTDSGYTSHVSGSPFTVSTNSLNLMGLTQGKFYYVRIVANNGSASSTGLTGNFTTLHAGQVGVGTSTTSNFPIGSGSAYNYTQQIYTKAQIESNLESGKDFITKIKFYYNGSSSIATPSTAAPSTTAFENWTIYIGKTSKTQFATTTDWVPAADLQESYSGIVAFPAPGNWMEIILSTPFQWDGESNIVVAIDENSPGSYSTAYFRSFTSGSNTGMYVRGNNDINPFSPGTATSRVSALAQIVFDAIETPDCMPVTDILVDEITPYMANVSWAGAGEYYELEFGPAGFTIGSGIRITDADNPSEISGLLADTNYEVYVRQMCGSSYSPWLGPIGFRSAIACYAPTTLTANQLTVTSTELSWQSTDNRFEVKWGVLGFDLATEGNLVTNITQTSYTLGNLDMDLQYQYYVRTNCTSSSNGYSTWTGPFTFKVGYCSSVPSSLDGQGISNVAIGGTSFPVTNVTYYKYPSVVNIQAGLNITSAITFVTGYTYNTNIWIDFNDNGQFEASELVYQGESVNTNPTILNTSFFLDSSTSLGEHMMRIGTADTGQAVPNPCYSGTYGVTIDVVVNILPPPSCLPPANASISDITANSARVNLVAEGDNFDVIWGAVGFNPENSGTVVSGIANGGTLNGLTPLTNYEFYVRQDCGSGVYSIWVGPVGFKTLCVPASIVSTSGADICGVGEAVISAQAEAGANIVWFDSATGGNKLALGDSFTTPVLSETTSYWVSAIDGDMGNGARLAPTSNSATTSLNYGLVFTATQAFVLETVDVYLTGTAGVMVVNLTNTSGTVLQTRSVALPAGNTNTPLKYTVTLDFDIEPGQYRLIAASSPNMVRESSIGGFPYAVGDVATITDGYISGTSTNYYYFYNWSYRTGCPSPRQEVVVTVTPAPAFALSETVAEICSGDATAVITIAEGGNDFDTFEWTPNIGVSGDATTGWTFNANQTTVYTLVASQSSGDGCTTSVTFTVNVIALPSQITINGSTEICMNEIVPLTIEGYNNSNTAILGNATATTPSSTSWPNPFSKFYGGVKHQMLYTAAELSAQGLAAGSSISAISFDFAAINTSANNVCTDFTIRMGHTNATEMTSGFVSGTTNVYGPLSYVPTQTGLVTFELNSVFVWDGVSNLIVETVHNSGNGGAGSGTTTKASNTSFVSVYRVAKDNVSGGIAGFDSTTFTTTGSHSVRPDVRFEFAKNEVITWSPASDLYVDQAATIPYQADTHATAVYYKPSVADVITYTVTNTNSLGCTVSNEITIESSNKWIGITSSDWNTPSNWCGNTVPTINTVVFIAPSENNPVISTIAQAGSITVAQGAELTITASGNLLQSDNAVNSGVFNVTRETTPLVRQTLAMWSSPVQSYDLRALSGFTLANRVYYYDGRQDNVYVPFTTQLNTYMHTMPNADAAFQEGNEDFVLGRGYFYRVPNTFSNTAAASHVGTFTGVANNGEVSGPALRSGFHSLGNPYPSTISAQDFIALNAEGVAPSIYGVWGVYNFNEATQTFSGALSLAGSNEPGVDDYTIEKGNGFLVWIDSNPQYDYNSTQTYAPKFDNSIRNTLANANGLVAMDRHRYWLNLAKDNTSVGSTLVAYMPTATNNVDGGIELPALHSGVASLYSVVDNGSYIIQGRALPFENSDVVNLGFRTNEAGTYSISIPAVEGLFSQGQEIILVDNLTQTQTNISNSAYEFVSEAGEFNGRFQIVYRNTLSTDNPEGLNDKWVAYTNNSTITLQSVGFEFKQVELIDLLGRTIYSSKADGTMHQINKFGANQVLIVKVTTSSGVVLTKKINN